MVSNEHQSGLKVVERDAGHFRLVFTDPEGAEIDLRYKFPAAIAAARKAIRFERNPKAFVRRMATIRRKDEQQAAVKGATKA